MSGGYGDGNFAAHLNPWLEQREPNWFELLAQHSLSTALRPAVNHAIKVLAQHYPERWGFLWRFHSELYALLDFLLQRHYLKHFAASFAENFYDLRRVPATLERSNCCRAGMCASHRRLSLLFLVFLPYIKHRLDEYFEQVQDSRPSSTPWRRKLQQLFVILHPWLHLLWEGSAFVYQLVYLFRKTPYFTPFLHLSGLKLSRVTKEDLEVFEKSADLSSSSRPFHLQLLLFPLTTLSRAVGLLASGLPLFAFCLKFVEWWQNEDYGHRYTTASSQHLPVPPPPLTGTQSVVSLPSHPVLCPLCGQVRHNSTALSTSGYVFCYGCIYRYVREHSQCPVTRLPTSCQQLVRIYSDDDGASVAS